MTTSSFATDKIDPPLRKKGLFLTDARVSKAIYHGGIDIEGPKPLSDMSDKAMNSLYLKM